MIAMLRAGARALVTRWRLAAALYGIQLFVTLLFTWAVARALAQTFGRMPLFDRGVDGDLVALSHSLLEHTDLLAGLAQAGLALAVGYAVLSWWLSAGLVGALTGVPFAEAAGRWFWPFARVWLLSLVPYGVSLLALSILLGAGAASATDGDALRWGTMVGRPLLIVLPALVMLAITACAVDYARALLVVGGTRGAARAFLGAFRLMWRRKVALAHYLLYQAVWIGVGVAYVVGTFDARTSLVVVLVLRQLVALARFAARFATVAGQVDLTGRCAPSARAP